MRKNIRKIPESIYLRLKELKGDVRVAVVIEGTAEEVESRFSKMGMKVDNGELKYPAMYFPDNSAGRYSRKNIRGYSILRKDLPKVFKTFYCGERYPFGDITLTSFSLHISKRVYQRDEFGPKNNVIGIEKISDYIKDGKKIYVLKFVVDEVLNPDKPNFKALLLFNLNLLQENVGKIDVFGSDTTEKEYLKAINVAWELLPPGERDDNLLILMNGIRKLDENTKAQIEERYDFLNGLNPQKLIKGMSGMTRYFGFMFSDKLVVLENLEYGNALYVLFENWEILSTLSRTELFNRQEKDYERIVHNKKYWKNQVHKIVSDTLNEKQ